MGIAICKVIMTSEKINPIPDDYKRKTIHINTDNIRFSSALGTAVLRWPLGRMADYPALVGRHKALVGISPCGPSVTTCALLCSPEHVYRP